MAKDGTKRAGDEALRDHAAAIRMAIGVLEGDMADVEALRGDVARVLIRAVEGIEAVVGGAS